jgi:hypothetical protein
MEHESYSYLRGLGIEKSDTIDEAGGRDYDLLYLPGKAAENEGILGDDLAADEKRAELPRRIVIGEYDSDKADGLPLATTDERIVLPDEEEKAKSAILDVYDAWLRFIVERRSLKMLPLSIYFEDLDHAANAWNEYLSLSADFIDFNAFAGSSGDPARDNLDKRNYDHGILLWRHMSLPEVLGRSHRPVYYRHEKYTNKLFAYLSSVNPESQSFQAKYLIRQIVEMALCRGVIVDERVAQTVASKTQQLFSNGTSDAIAVSKSLAHELAWMGLWIVGRIVFKRKLLGEDGEEKVDEFTIGVEPNSRNGLISLVMTFDPDKRKFDCSVEYPEGLPHFPEEPEAIEILSLHQSIFDTNFEYPIRTLFGHMGDISEEKWSEHWVMKTRSDVLFTCFHSGRGHPRERLPANAAFLEYSILQVHLLNQSSKFFFTQQALASKN